MIVNRLINISESKTVKQLIPKSRKQRQEKAKQMGNSAFGLGSN